jgi:hypothetical protein
VRGDDHDYEAIKIQCTLPFLSLKLRHMWETGAMQIICSCKWRLQPQPQVFFWFYFTGKYRVELNATKR